MTSALPINNPVTPLPAPVGRLISVSPNVILALSFLENYLRSTYDLQIADTKLEAAISNQEAALVQQFESDMNSSSEPSNQTATYQNWLYKMTQSGADVTTDAQMYAACSSANQALTKMMDGNNTTAQNTLNQNSQGQQGDINAMSSINGIGGNLTRLIQG